MYKVPARQAGGAGRAFCLCCGLFWFSGTEFGSTGARNQLTEVFSGDATCGGSSLKERFYRGCGGRVLAVLAACVAWMCARLRLGLARPALPARGCAVPVAPPSATTTQQGEHVLVRASAGITLRSLLSLPPPRLAIPAPQSPHDSSFHGVVPP